MTRPGKQVLIVFATTLAVGLAANAYLDWRIGGAVGDVTLCFEVDDPDHPRRVALMGDDWYALDGQRVGGIGEVPVALVRC